MSCRYFRNEKCECFPCHAGIEKEDFNCLFCYCPLYPLGENCGGDFLFTSAGVKDCTDCAFPHRRENYENVLEKLK